MAGSFDALASQASSLARSVNGALGRTGHVKITLRTALGSASYDVDTLARVGKGPASASASDDSSPIVKFLGTLLGAELDIEVYHPGGTLFLPSIPLHPE